MTAPPLLTFPARPIQGGRLELALPKRGLWFIEPKLNGWRALIHTPSGTMWNRHGALLTIADCFRPALAALAKLGNSGLVWPTAKLSNAATISVAARSSCSMPSRKQACQSTNGAALCWKHYFRGMGSSLATRAVRCLPMPPRSPLRCAPKPKPMPSTSTFGSKAANRALGCDSLKVLS